MYPMFIGQAKRDANNDAFKTFFWANEAEQSHADFFEKALESLKQGKDIQVTDIHVCSVCGNTIEGELPEKCPVCGEARDKFFQPG